MSFETDICLRYLKAKREQGFISLITFISVAGVAVGVMALIVVLAVMTGFTSELRNKIIGVNSHIIVQHKSGLIHNHQDLIKRVTSHHQVISATPYVYAQVMISGNTNSGIVLRGFEPVTGGDVISLPGQIIAGDLKWLARENKARQDLPGIVLGKHLARQLMAAPGDSLRLLSPSGPLTPMGVIPKIKTCRVVAIFDTGMYEYDSSLAYVSLTTAQQFLGIDQAVHGLELKIDDLYQADIIARELAELTGPSYITKDWMGMNHNLFSALKLEKTAMFIVLALIVLVAAFNIISTLIMVVMEKSREIAILKSMGATSGAIMRIFVYEGLIIGCSGMIIGVGGGLGLCKLLSRYQFIKLPGDVYPMSTLPVKVLAIDVGIVAFSAVIITFLATIYPAWKASRVDPVEGLRY